MKRKISTSVHELDLKTPHMCITQSIDTTDSTGNNFITKALYEASS
jgi:hypothetical protein